MALAGPMANFAIVLVSVLAIHVGRSAGLLQLSGQFAFDGLVRATADGLMQPVAALLSVLFSLNLLLGAFNLLPFPPLDGFNVLGLFLPEGATHKLMNFRDSLGGMAIIGLLVAWRAFDYVFEPVFINGLRLLYLPQ